MYSIDSHFKEVTLKATQIGREGRRGIHDIFQVFIKSSGRFFLSGVH